MATASNSSATIKRLLQDMPHVWRGTEHADIATVGTGFTALDNALPDGGWPCGALIEIGAATIGIGEFALIVPALRKITAQNKHVALVRPPYMPYAPALHGAGLPLKQLLWVTKAAESDALWAAEQLLREGAGAVAIWSDTNDRTLLRRLQLAAESGRALGFLYRSAKAANQPSPAAVRIGLLPLGEKLRLELLKVRRGQPATISLQIPWGPASA